MMSSTGETDAPDSALLSHAREHGQVIVTHDLDFGLLLAMSADELPSVIQIRAKATLPIDLGDQMLEVLTVARGHLEAGALMTLSSAAHRVSILPLTMRNG